MNDWFLAFVVCSAGGVAFGYVRAKLERSLSVADYVINGLLIGLMFWGLFVAVTSGIS